MSRGDELSGERSRLEHKFLMHQGESQMTTVQQVKCRPRVQPPLSDGTHRMSKSARDPDEGREPETVKLPEISTLTSRAQLIQHVMRLNQDFRTDCWFLGLYRK